MKISLQLTGLMGRYAFKFVAVTQDDITGMGRSLDASMNLIVILTVIHLQNS